MAANPFTAALKDFWHSMTSSDRHATHDSPYRTGNHMAINQNRHAPLTSVTSAEGDSHVEQSSLSEENKRPSITIGSPSRPYSPGMRSLSSPKVPKLDVQAVSGEIQMQSFDDDGAPPPPPPKHSWMKIDRWAETNYEELFDQLGDGCTQNDVNELEHELDMSLPQDLRVSLGIHDGQERGGRPTGIVLGAMLLDCEEIVQEWKQWKVVNEEYLQTGRKAVQPIYPIKSLNGTSSSSAAHNKSHHDKVWRQELLDKQDSVPVNAIQRAYAHPGWIPLIRDWGGNNIAVDLAPGPSGKWGQVILFGRDYDTKYVVARSWAHFLSIVADDITSSRVVIDEETGAMRLKEFKTETVEPAYMDILRWRADQRYGRGPQQRRRPLSSHKANNQIDPPNGKTSPYGSPTRDDRGRSPHRFGRHPSDDSRRGIRSPLSRVQEEVVVYQPQPIRPLDISTKNLADYSNGKLVDVPTPTDEKKQTTEPSKDFPRSTLSRMTTNEEKTDAVKSPKKGLSQMAEDDEMKTISL